MSSMTGAERTVRDIRHRPRHIVELGSGLSTVLFADYCAKRDAKLITFEENPNWVQLVETALPEALKAKHGPSQKNKVLTVDECRYDAPIPHAVAVGIHDTKVELDTGVPLFGKRQPLFVSSCVVASLISFQTRRKVGRGHRRSEQDRHDYLPAGTHELPGRDRATRHTVRAASARVDLPVHGAGADDQGQALANSG